MNISSQSERGGKRLLVKMITIRPVNPAIVARATVRKKGSKPATASRVAGNVPANMHMPTKPSNNPNLSREMLAVSPERNCARILLFVVSWLSTAVLAFCASAGLNSKWAHSPSATIDFQRLG
jgi:hypothetical protein